MRSGRRARLEAAGWKIGSATEFLGLTPEEEALVEIKLGLARELKEVRAEKGLSQVKAAEILGSSQSRVAKMESADKTVSLDLLVRSLVALGSSRRRVARAIAK
ncbi:MAG: helix-turn-helix domain-containing protein [Thermoanaerobaculia bacterium]